MKATTPKPGDTRRDRINKASSTVFVTVAIAAVVIVFSIVSLRFLWNQKNYNTRVIKEKTSARDILSSNVSNLEKLKEQFPELESGGLVDESAILHSLPPVYDYAGLFSSLNYLARESGVKLVGGIGEDLSATAVKSSGSPEPIELPLSISVKGRPDKVRDFLEILEASTRPFLVSSVEVTGAAKELTASIVVNTYYQPAANLEIPTEEIK